MEKTEPGFEVRVHEMASTIGLEDYQIHPTVRSLATIALHSVEVKYGENSENPLPQHNAEHAIATTERAIELTNLLYDYIPEEYKDNIYELVILAGVSHDWEQLQGNGANEQASADYLISLIEQTGNSFLNTDRFKQRARAGIMATEHEFDEEKGVINQVNLMKDEPYEDGKPDPLRFIMAFADINAIAMKGPDQMFQDATRLFFERHRDNPTEEELQKMLDYQLKFIRSQLNDHRMKPYIARYFPDFEPPEGSKENNLVYDVMWDAYNTNITDSHTKARRLKGSSGAIVKEVRNLLPTLDVHSVAARIASFVHKDKSE